MYQQKIRKVKCGKCDLMIPLKLWREHTLQHTALTTLQLDNYPPSFLALTKHYCKLLEKTGTHHRKTTARLTNAYDALKMLYFKEFKEYSEDLCHSNSPTFDKMTEALAPKNYNFSTWNKDETILPPSPYSFGITIEQLHESIFHAQEQIQELRHVFFTAHPGTPELEQENGSLWGCALIEGLKGNTAARYTAKNYWSLVKESLSSHSYPSPSDIRKAMKRSLHKIDVALKQGHEELGQSRWSGVTGCMCILQATPQQDVSGSRPSTAHSNNTCNGKGSMGILHVVNIGSVTAVLSRNGCPKRISYCHTARDAAEKQRVVSKGAAVSSSGQVNCVTTVTRALGFHGDVNLRQCLSQKPYCSSVPLYESDEFLIMANATFWKYLGAEEACNMCRSLLTPSLRKLIHIFTTLPNEAQEEALSNASTLDYDALVSDFGDNSQDSSMIPDNESESNAGEIINWEDMFRDPIETLTLDDVSRLLSDTMAHVLVEGARLAGAVGPVACNVVLLQGALPAVRKRLYYEQAIYELKKMFEDFEMSEASLMSSTAGDAVSVMSTGSGVNLLPPSFEALDQYEPSESPTDMVSHQMSGTKSAAPYQLETIGIAQHMTLDPGHLVLKNSHGVLKLSRQVEKKKYKDLNLESLRLEDVDDASLSKQEQRDMIRDMVTMAIKENTTPEPEGETVSSVPTAVS